MLKNSSTVPVSLLAGLLVSTTAHAGKVQFDAEKIKAALQTVTLEEKGFVDRALRMVDEEKLSPELVQGTFVRARKQQRLKFQQFKFGLLAQVSDPALRSELVNGKPPPAAPPASFSERVASRLQRLRLVLSIPGIVGIIGGRLR